MNRTREELQEFCKLEGFCCTQALEMATQCLSLLDEIKRLTLELKDYDQNDLVMCPHCDSLVRRSGVRSIMSESTPLVETLITEVFSLISVAQRNGMTSSSAITVGIKPFLLELSALRAQAANSLDKEAIQRDEMERCCRDICGFCGNTFNDKTAKAVMIDKWNWGHHIDGDPNHPEICACDEARTRFAREHPAKGGA